jgi:hypothetical protein
MQRRLIKTSNHPLEVFVKNNARVTHDLEESAAIGAAFVAGVAAARAWASPHVDAAYGWAKPRWEKGVETAGPALQDTVRRTTEGIAGGIAVVTPRIQSGIDSVGPRITHVIDETTPKIQSTLDKATPALNSAKGKVVDDYLPALSNRLGEAADTAARSLAAATVPPLVEKVVTKATGDKKAVTNAQKRLVAATVQASKDLKRNQARKSGKGWLIVGIIASALVAGVAAWRASKPVEDPWKTPAPVNATPAPVAADKAQEAKDVVAEIKQAAERSATSSDDASATSKTPAADTASPVGGDTPDVTVKRTVGPTDEPKA